MGDSKETTTEERLRLSPRRFNSPLQTESSGAQPSSGKRRQRGKQQNAAASDAATVVASVVAHRKAEGGSHTVYEVIVNLRHGAETVSAWKVSRRYSMFHKLHSDLKLVGFPCPELPPKSLLWATFNTSSFLDQRKAALNVWLQGCICIWQSVPIEDLHASFEIAELLEAFLCEEDAMSEAKAMGFQSPFQVAKTQQRANSKNEFEEGGREKSSKEQLQELLWREVHIGQRVGVADISYLNDRAQKLQSFTTYKPDGKSVQQTFRPFTATVRFDTPGGTAFYSGDADSGKPQRELVSNTASCTPVSVPPTPDGQHEFLNSWGKYHRAVLDHVCSRLDGPRVNFVQSAATLEGHSACSSGNSSHSAAYQALAARDSRDNGDEVLRRASSEGGGALPSRAFSGSSSSGSGGGGSSNGNGNANAQAAGDTTGPNGRRERMDRHGAKLIRKLILEASNAVDFVGSSWEFLGKMKGVLLLRKQQEQGPGRSPLHCFMGRGAQDCAAHDVFDLVRDPSKRHVYDRMVRAGSDRIVEVLDGAYNPIVVHHHFETKQRLWFLSHSRDFCVLQYSAELDDGRFVVVGTSVRHNDCPPEEGTVRAKTGLFGWLIEPVGPTRCKTTYLIKVDFGGNVPLKFLESMSMRQPMCIRYIEEFLLHLYQEHSSEADGLDEHQRRISPVRNEESPAHGENESCLPMDHDTKKRSNERPANVDYDYGDSEDSMTLSEIEDS